MRICIVGASGKLGKYMVQHALDRGYEVAAVCREQSVAELAEFHARIAVVPGATDDREVMKRTVAGPWGAATWAIPSSRALVHEAPAIVSRQSPSVLAHATA